MCIFAIGGAGHLSLGEGLHNRPKGDSEAFARKQAPMSETHLELSRLCRVGAQECWRLLPVPTHILDEVREAFILEKPKVPVPIRRWVHERGIYLLDLETLGPPLFNCRFECLELCHRVAVLGLDRFGNWHCWKAG